MFLWKQEKASLSFFLSLFTSFMVGHMHAERAAPDRLGTV